MDRYVGYIDRQISEMYRKIDTDGCTIKRLMKRWMDDWFQHISIGPLTVRSKDVYCSVQKKTFLKMRFYFIVVSALSFMPDLQQKPLNLSLINDVEDIGGFFSSSKRVTLTVSYIVSKAELRRSPLYNYTIENN